MSTALVCFRKDLRIQDNPALYQACQNHTHIIPVFLYDKSQCTLGSAQKWWLYHSLKALGPQLAEHGMTLGLFQGDTEDTLMSLIQSHSVQAVYWNACWESRIRCSDTKIKEVLEKKGISVQVCSANVLIDPEKVHNKGGSIFQVFTPFWKHCLDVMVAPESQKITPRDRSVALESDDLNDWDFLPKHPDWAGEFSKYWNPGTVGAGEKFQDFIQSALTDYAEKRNNPGVNGTSLLSPHIHFGEISPWQIYRQIIPFVNGGNEGARVFLSQLGWREFSYYLLYHHPELGHKNFKNSMDHFPWKTDAALWKAWTKGQTGYPIIDAGMRQLWRSGTMHNRVRMIVASFLTKNLMTDWRLGAKWFMDTLLDADEANNSAGWQWVAGCGADAAPYFRIFNPILQSQKFDPDATYIKRWLPELNRVPDSLCHDPEQLASFVLRQGLDYPAPIVPLNETRNRALEAYKGLKNA
jgi:deoxyribodipyrimidine photo-lyase